MVKADGSATPVHRVVLRFPLNFREVVVYRAENNFSNSSLVFELFQWHHSLDGVFEAFYLQAISSTMFQYQYGSNGYASPLNQFHRSKDRIIFSLAEAF